MNGEVKIQLIDGKYDIDFNSSSGDFIEDEGLETSVLMSLLLDDRADESEVPQPFYRGGYFGYEINNMKFSKIWLISGRKTQAQLNLAIAYANECLQWLIDENYATNITSEATYSSDGINLAITISKGNDIILSKNYLLWLNTDF